MNECISIRRYQPTCYQPYVKQNLSIIRKLFKNFSDWMFPQMTLAHTTHFRTIGKLTTCFLND